MGGSSGSSASDTTNQQYIRYAPYVENYHWELLNQAYNLFYNGMSDNPFTSFTEINADAAFFGLGSTILNQLPIFGIFNSMLRDFDIQSCYNQLMSETMDSTVVGNLIAAENALMEDDINTNALPKLSLAVRDINSIMSSTYIIGRSLLLDTKEKMLDKFSAELKYKLLPVVMERWKATLDWHKIVTTLYMELYKFYFTAKIDTDNHNTEAGTKRRLWSFTLLEFFRVAVGTLQGATNSKTDVAGTSTVSKILGGALSGAAMGSMIGSTWNSAATPAIAGVNDTTSVMASSGSNAGSMWGAGIGAVLGAAAAYTY